MWVAACANTKHATRAPQNLRPWGEDCMRPNVVRKLREHIVENTLLFEKNTIKNQCFVKLFLLSFHLSAFEITFIKTSYSTLCRQNKFVYSLKTVHKWHSFIIGGQVNAKR